MSTRYFKELNLTPITQTIIILDIDGTLLADGEQEIDAATAAAVKKLLTQGNQIYLCSNGFSHKLDRNRRIAAELGIIFHETSHKKPLKAAVAPLIAEQIHPVIVIGDKFLTDGLLAVNLGVPYIPVRSLRSAKDPVHSKIGYRIDDIGRKIIGSLARPPHYIHTLYNEAPPKVITLLTQLPTLPKSILHRLMGRLTHSIAREVQGTAESLCEGLNEIGVAYRYNPWQHQVSATVGILNGIDTLRWALNQKKKGFIKTIIASSTLVSVPTEENHLIQDPGIDQIVAPSLRVKNWWLSFDQSLDRQITPWAAGVQDRGSGRNAKGVCIVYSKNTDEKLFSKIIECLWTYKLPIIVSKYGQFVPHEYHRILSKAKMMVYLSDFGNQEIAMTEAWMADIPTLVHAGGELQYKDHQWKEDQVSAPYFDPQCGLLFTGDSDFEPRLIEFLEKYETFTPRRYASGYFTRAICARKYLEITERADENV